MPEKYFLRDFFLSTFVVTYVASRVGHHSTIHMYIAEIALFLELAGLFLALPWIYLRWEWLTIPLYLIAVSIVLCFLAVMLTDQWYMRTIRKIFAILQYIL